MNNSSNHHEPSAEFRAQLKREIARAVRSDQLFGAPPAPARRIATALGIAAGVVLTLLTGVVLGASASYASAAEPDAARPAFAMRPITNALTAIGCGITKTEPQTPKVAQAKPSEQPAPVVTVPPEATAAAVVLRSPDRAKIAALATQHQPHVVRGDTAAQYMVMVMDAADNYLWSTYGSGSLSIEIGGDTRTAEERMAFKREHIAEYQGTTAGLFPKVIEFERGAYAKPGIKALDSAHSAPYWRLRDKTLHDTLFRAFLDTLNLRQRTGATGDGGARGGGAGSARSGGGARGAGGIPDSIVAKMHERDGFWLRTGDSTFALYAKAMVGGRDIGAGRGGLGIFPDGVSPSNAPDGSYKIGWGSVNSPPSERATGIVSAGNGQSGIEGLPSAWLSMGESYVFAPGELAPQMLRIVVVHLTPGTTWKGR